MTNAEKIILLEKLRNHFSDAITELVDASALIAEHKELQDVRQELHLMVGDLMVAAKMLNQEMKGLTS